MAYISFQEKKRIIDDVKSYGFYFYTDSKYFIIYKKGNYDLWYDISDNCYRLYLWHRKYKMFEPLAEEYTLEEIIKAYKEDRKSRYLFWRIFG